MVAGIFAPGKDDIHSDREVQQRRAIKQQKISRKYHYMLETVVGDPILWSEFQNLLQNGGLGHTNQSVKGSLVSALEIYCNSIIYCNEIECKSRKDGKSQIYADEESTESSSTSTIEDESSSSSWFTINAFL